MSAILIYIFAGSSNGLLRRPEQDHLWRGRLGWSLTLSWLDVNMKLSDFFFDWCYKKGWPFKTLAIVPCLNICQIKFLHYREISNQTQFNFYNCNCRWLPTISGFPTSWPSASSSLVSPGSHQMFLTFLGCFTSADILLFVSLRWQMFWIHWFLLLMFITCCRIFGIQRLMFWLKYKLPIKHCQRHNGPRV